MQLFNPSGGYGSMGWGSLLGIVMGFLAGSFLTSSTPAGTSGSASSKEAERKLQTSLESTEKKLQRANGKIKSLETAVKELPKGNGFLELRTQFDELENANDGLAKAHRNANAETAAALSDLKAVKAERKELQTRVAELQRKVESSKGRVTSTRSVPLPRDKKWTIKVIHILLKQSVAYLEALKLTHQNTGTGKTFHAFDTVIEKLEQAQGLDVNAIHALVNEAMQIDSDYFRRCLTSKSKQEKVKCCGCGKVNDLLSSIQDTCGPT